MLEESKRRRTSEDFLAFCRMILDYENYEEDGRRMAAIHHRVEAGRRSEDVEDEETSSSSDGRVDKEGFNDVTCYCKKPFAGRPMIECSSCLTWIHLSCAKIKRTHIPDTWNCSKCSDKPLSNNNTSSSSSSTSVSNATAKRSSRKRKTSPSKGGRASSINLTL